MATKTSSCQNEATIACLFCAAYGVTHRAFSWSALRVAGLCHPGNKPDLVARLCRDDAVDQPGDFEPCVLPCLSRSARGDRRRNGFSFVDDANARAGLLAFAFVLYLTTTVVTTAVGNIPLNGHLEAFDARGATGAEVDAARVGYERPWNRWHDVRTVSSASLFVLCVLAAFVDVS